MTVVMPAGAVASKVAACLEYGAEVVLHGTHVGEAMQRMHELVEERGLTLVHPYDQPEVLLGNGSCGLEILEDLPDVDVVVAGGRWRRADRRRDGRAQGVAARGPRLRRRAARAPRR